MGKRLQCPFAVGDVGRCYRDRMGQSQRIDSNMAFDTRDFLARVIALKACSVTVLDALGIDD